MPDQVEATIVLANWPIDNLLLHQKTIMNHDEATLKLPRTFTIKTTIGTRFGTRKYDSP